MIAIDDGSEDPMYDARTLTWEDACVSKPFGTVLGTVPSMGDKVQVCVDGCTRKASFYHGDVQLGSVPLEVLYADDGWPLYPAVWIIRPTAKVSIQIVEASL